MILNLTQHAATAEQIADGVFDLPAPMRSELQRLLTFERLPTADAVNERALAIVALVFEITTTGCSAMIGGAPYLMAPLERALREIGVTPVYAFSERVSAEETQADGSVRKVNVFRHVGWVAA